MPALLIQILLPLYDNRGQAHGKALLQEVERELVERHGGVTSHVRAPARGKWVDDAGQLDRDEIVILEVMTDVLDETWWSEYRDSLERRFAQSEIVIRAISMRLV